MKIINIVLSIICIAVQSCVTQGEPLELDNSRMVEIPAIRTVASIPEKSMVPTPAIILLSGGGYSSVAAKGTLIEWKNIMTDNGIALFSVDYTLPNGNPDLPINDVITAYKHIKTNWSDYNINPNLIGIMGLSAGGHLASLIATKYGDQVDVAFQLLIYPVISLEANLTHWGSRICLLGDVSEDVAKEYTSDFFVSQSTSSAYIVLSDPDDYVSPENGRRYHRALLNNNVESHLVVLNKGGHGWQMSNCPDIHAIEEMIGWVKLIENGSSK